MSKFSIKQEEKKTSGTATFHKESDYKVVKLTKSGKTTMLHKLQADKLIKEKKAELVKDVAVTSKTGKRTSVEVDKD
jgi:hypothetical protein